MKDYKVRVSFTFTGVFLVKADNRTEARKMIEQDCGMTFSGGITSTLPDDQINWDFDVHPEKKITSFL